MKKIIVFVAILGAFQITNSQDTKKVLFLGNSYTASNNLPNLISQMATNTGDVLIYDSNTPGGYRLMNHSSNTNTINKINANNWDFVALQAQSQETSWGQTQMENELYPFATQLVNTIRTNNTCSQPLFYMTWGRENGDTSNCEFVPWVCTYEGMDDAIRNTYTYMAKENTSEVAPVSSVWRYLRVNHPEIDLYSNDGSHPSLAGSYAAACVFYTMIYKKDPTLITWNSTLSETTTDIIKQTTKLFVFDVINDWDFTANFDFVVNDNEVSFNNTYNTDSVVWDFNDGNTSIQNNPIHIYNETGDYEVTLTINTCGRTHSLTKTVNINTLNIKNNSLNLIEIYPNPTTSTIRIKGLENIAYNATLYNILGHEVLNIKNTTNHSISLSELEKGTYFLKISSGKSLQIKKVIKQ